jgi:hypothetical protein
MTRRFMSSLRTSTAAHRAAQSARETRPSYNACVCVCVCVCVCLMAEAEKTCETEGGEGHEHTRAP